jgi:hypothetical protein
MYDMVNGVFYPSVSSTQFVAGPQISSGDSSANLISFTINGTSYQAEEGMTWAEWVASSYNTGGYTLSGTYISAPDGGSVYDTTQMRRVSSSTIIVSGGVYGHSY